MKKICICTTISTTMKAFVVPTVEYLYEQCGYDVTLICSEDIDFQRSLPEYIHFIPVHMARGIDVKGFEAIKEFIRIFKSENFDMVQYSTPNASCYASIAARVCKVPIRLYCQWGIRYVGLNGGKRQIFKFIEKMVCRNSTDIRPQSPLNMAFGISEHLYKARKAKVVGNGGTVGVDTKVYNISKKEVWRKEIREKYNLSNEDFVFGFSGRITVDKGCAELFEAFRNLERNNVNAKLFIVGPMDENCGICRELIIWAENSKNVILTGMVDGKDMCKYYASMDVLVHPTYREGFGMVIQEAGALAIPVITTRVPGASEVLEDGVSSVHVAVKNVKELELAMFDFFQNPQKVNMFSKQAYVRTKKLYDRSIMLENQRKDYISLIGN